MWMQMVSIGHMRVAVLQGFVAVRVAVGAGRQNFMGVQMVAVGPVGVMAVGVFVLQNRVGMRVAMRFKQVQNHTCQHQQTSASHDPAHGMVAQGQCT